MKRSITSYKEALEMLYRILPSFSHLDPKTVTSLDKIKTLCHQFGYPQNKLQFIHVAGTNGKGSVSHLLASMLMEAGYNTGLHTSPHLIDFKERTQVNGKYIDEHFIIQKVNELLLQDWLLELKPSFFDVSIWLAWEYFKYAQVDYVVLETGLGGRKDSTNIISPLLSIITNISFDHQAILGNTLNKIAKEKAGIIKHQTPVVIGKYDEEYASIFVKKANEMYSSIFFADQQFKVSQIDNNFELSLYQVNDIKQNKHFQIACPLSGFYQSENIATVLQSVNVLNTIIPKTIDEHTLKNAFLRVKTNTKLRARWDCVSTSPLVVVDGAHNTSALAETIKQVRATSEKMQKKVLIIFGMLKDKDIEPCLQMLPREYEYFFCETQFELRKLPARILAKKASQLGIKGRSFDSVESAIVEALNSKKDYFIFITGSLYIAGEAIHYFDRLSNR